MQSASLSGDTLSASGPSPEFGQAFVAEELSHILSPDAPTLREKSGLAEMVNNIVEHAHAGMGPGRVLLRAMSAQVSLQLSLVDWGAPLPDEELPEARPTDIETAPADLPEGGFGWFLIRTLARDLRYRRADGRNHLRLTFDLIPATT